MQTGEVSVHIKNDNSPEVLSRLSAFILPLTYLSDKPVRFYRFNNGLNTHEMVNDNVEFVIIEDGRVYTDSNVWLKHLTSRMIANKIKTLNFPEVIETKSGRLLSFDANVIYRKTGTVVENLIDHVDVDTASVKCFDVKAGNFSWVKIEAVNEAHAFETEV